MSAEKILNPNTTLIEEHWNSEKGFPLYVLRGIWSELARESSISEEMPADGDIFSGRQVLLFTPYLHTQQTDHQSNMIFASRQQAVAHGYHTEGWGRQQGSEILIRTVVTTQLTAVIAEQIEQSGIDESSLPGYQVVTRDNQKSRSKTIAQIRAAFKK